MKKYKHFSLLLAGLFAYSAASFGSSPCPYPETPGTTDGKGPERKTEFDQGWKFYRGSIANAEQSNFNDTRWRIVDLPHDWSMDPTPVQKAGITVGPFSQYNEGGAGGADIGQTLGGEGWYRKSFTLTPEDRNKKIILYVEGAQVQSEVYVNGKKVRFNPYGYTSYKVDITNCCNPVGQPNFIAIRTLNVGQNSRWYAGSGLYRHVWLIKTDKVYLEEWDTFARLTQLEKKKKATIKVTSFIHNERTEQKAGTLQLRIYDPDGKTVAVENKSFTVAANDSTLADFEVTLRKARLWSVETPELYTAYLTLTTGTDADSIRIPFGIRTLSFSAEKGFQLNGETIKLRGGCLHHDNGLLGAAAIDRAEVRKVELMKANGFNAVRCSHNQVSEAFLNACDSLGLLVIHETFDQWQQAKRDNDYHQYFDEWSDSDLASSVRRDRNHPSIIMWSIGNEIAQRADQPQGDEISKRLVQTVRKYDDTRFTTAGVNDFWDRPDFKWDTDSYRAFQNIDVAGYNYMWHKFESDHEAYPQRVMYGSESYPKETGPIWNMVEKHPYIIGDFVWTAIDYIGEAGLAHTLELAQGEWNPQFMGWPWYNAWCGDIDLCGDKKPQSYYRDVVWRLRDIAMAVRRPLMPGKQEVVNGWGWTDELPSWNWNGLEGQTMRVNVYSRAPKVRLYLNGQVVGEKETNPDNYTATFQLPYAPGELKAVNLEKGKEKSAFTLKTTGKAAAIRLTADRNRIKADRNDLSYVKIELIDAEGQVVPDADQTVTLRCEGAGHIAASGNAAPDDMESFRSLTPRTFRGRALAILQPNGEETGTITLTVTAENLGEQTITVNTF